MPDPKKSVIKKNSLADALVTKVPAKQFFSNYMSSDIYGQRLENFGINDKPNIQNLLNTRISEVNGPGSIAYNQDRSNATDTIHARFPISKGESNINIDRGQIGYINKMYGVNQKQDSQMAHELSHVTRDLSPSESEFIASLNKKPDEVSVYNEWKKGGFVDSSLNPLSFTDYLNIAYKGTHDARPNEIKADLDALRFQMQKKNIYDTSKRDMTMDDYNKLLQDKDIKQSLELKRLKDRFKPEDIIKINNTIASNNENYSSEFYGADGGVVTNSSPNYIKTDNPNIYRGKYGVDITIDGYNTSAKNGFKFTNFDSYADWVGSWAKKPADINPEQMKQMYSTIGNTGNSTGQKFKTYLNNGQTAGYINQQNMDNQVKQVKATHNPNMYFAEGGKIYNPDLYGQTTNNFDETDPLNYNALTNEGFYNNQLNSTPGTIADTLPASVNYSATKGATQFAGTQQVPTNTSTAGTIAGTLGSVGQTLTGASQKGGKLANTKLGNFINSDAGSYAGAGLSAATGLVSAFSGSTNSSAAKGKAIGSAIGTVADVATFGLPIFSTLGGAVGGLIGGKADKKENSLRNKENQAALANKKNILVQSNDQRYGSNFYGEDGGEVMDMTTNYMDEPQQQAQPVKVNIEKGEISVDPDGKVLRDFKNPNRFSAHNKNPYKEPSGNFIDLNEGEIIVPKKFAKLYKDGDDITKKSILRTILEQQKDNPAQNLPAQQQEDMHMADGGVAYKYPLNVRKIDPGIIDLPNIDYTQQYDPIAMDKITEQAPQVTIQSPTNIDYKSPYTAQGNQNTTQGNYSGTQSSQANPSKNNTNYAYYADRALPYIAQGINLAIANKPDDILSLEHNANTHIAQNYLENLDTNYDTSLNLHQNQQALGTAQRSLHDFNSPASKVQASEMLGQTLNSNNQVINTKNNTETQLRNQKNSALSQFLNNTGLQDEQERLRYQQERRMNEGNRLSGISQIVSNVSDIAQQQFNDSERVRSLNSMTDFHDLNPGTKSLINDDPNARDKILKLVNSGYNMQTAVKMVLGIQAAEDGKDSSSSQRQSTKTQVKTGNRTTTTTSSSSNRD